MKPLDSALREGPRRALEADIHAVAAALFQRWPALVGFSLDERDDSEGQLELTVSLYPEPGYGERSLLMREIAQTMIELMDEAPDTAPLLRARTFARTLH